MPHENAFCACQGASSYENAATFPELVTWLQRNAVSEGRSDCLYFGYTDRRWSSSSADNPTHPGCDKHRQAAVDVKTTKHVAHEQGHFGNSDTVAPHFAKFVSRQETFVSLLHYAECHDGFFTRHHLYGIPLQRSRRFMFYLVRSVCGHSYRTECPRTMSSTALLCQIKRLQRGPWLLASNGIESVRRFKNYAA
jgi:hypothetical protein